MKVVMLSALRTRRLNLQKIFLLLILVRGWVDPRSLVRLGGSRRWKIPLTTRGTESATFRLEAPCLNQLCHRVPSLSKYTSQYLKNCNLKTIDLFGTPPHRHNRTQDADFQLETPLIHRQQDCVSLWLTYGHHFIIRESYYRNYLSGLVSHKQGSELLTS